MLLGLCVRSFLGRGLRKLEQKTTKYVGSLDAINIDKGDVRLVIERCINAFLETTPHGNYHVNLVIEQIMPVNTFVDSCVQIHNKKEEKLE